MKIAILEFGGSHDECIYSQLLFLAKSGHEVTLLINKRIKNRIPLKDFDAKYTYTFGDNPLFLSLEFRRLTKQLDKFDKVIINTIENKKCLKFLKTVDNLRPELIGVLHNVHKKSLLKDLPVQKFLVLSENLLINLKKELVANEKANFFYPIFLRDSGGRPEKSQIKKPLNEIWICIPGQVENQRRDYLHLLSLLGKVRLKKEIKFILLGNGNHRQGSGELLKAKMAELELSDRFIQFDGFVPSHVFHQYMQESDWILPLIHAGNPEFEHYQRTKVSGAFNLAFTYHLPLLMDDSFQTIEEFTQVAVFYKKNELITVINSLKEIDRSKIIEGYQSNKWTFEENRKRYISLIDPD